LIISKDMSGDHPLISLASDASQAAREALVAGTVEKLLDGASTPSPAEQKLFSEILVKLYKFARKEIRERLCTALATADWAPVELVRELALDTLDIAQPIISFCPTITDEILIEVIVMRDFEHRLCVADRPCIGETVSARLIATGNDIIVGTLARNATAKIKASDYKKAMDVLLSRPDDLDVLILRHDLPPSLIAAAYGLAGEQTRLSLSMRLPSALEHRLSRLTAFVTADAAEGHTAKRINKALSQKVQGTVRQNHLKPTPGSLIAALMRSERDIFFDGLADLLDLPRSCIEGEMMLGDTQKIALVTRAANFDMTIVRTIFETIAAENQTWTLADDRMIALIWMRYSPLTARMQFASSCDANGYKH
jgi:uncharacterized protein (DUF2336 family)